MRKALLCTVGSIFILSVGLGCTRKAGTSPIRITIPVSQKVGALINYSLEVAILNVQIAGRPPLLLTKEFHDSTSVPFGSTITFEVPDVPNGASVYIQALNVYKGDTIGDMKFYYNDQSVLVSGLTTVSLNLQPSGTSNGKEAQIFGRYLTTATPADAGPTGTLALLYDVGNGKPPMIVQRGYIVNGWFEAFAVQGANFDIVIEETGFKLFDDLNLTTAGALQHLVAGVMTPVTFGTHRLDMLKPTGFRREYNSATVKPEPETHMILGFFDNTGSDSLVTGKTVLYPSAMEGVPGAFIDSALTILQNYKGSGGSGTDIRPSSGGALAALGAMYTLNEVGCSSGAFTSGNCLLFYHAKMANNGREGFSGAHLPFRVIDSFSLYGGYLRGKFKPNGCSGAHCVELKWDLLPGAGAALGDIEIWRKYSANTSSSNSHNLKCQDLPGLGYSVVGLVTTPAVTQTFDFIEGGLDQNSLYNYQFYLCPRASTAAGIKYVGRPLRADCLSAGGCSNDTGHFGWSLGSATPTTIGTTTPHNSFRRVNGNIVTTNALYTDVELVSFTSEFQAGDEVLIHVTGTSGGGACGSQGAQPISAGAYSFARVINTPGLGVLRITKGSILDDMAGVSNATFTNATTATFCFVQVVKVLHYNNLTINASVGLEAAVFGYAGGGGGILPVRISGTLSLNGNSFISATGRGFVGGSAANHGAGVESDVNNVSPAQNAGRRGPGTPDLGGGGGGYGRGGQSGGGGDGVGGMGITSGSGMVRMVMGGGGGGPGISGSGANGGGIVFVLANKIETNNSSGNFIDVSSDAAVANGGGGGGGSSFVYTRKLSGTSGISGTLGLFAKGGNGTGGIGGGGSITNMICSNDTTYPVALNKSVAKGSTGNDSGLLAQDGQLTDWDVSQYSYLCQSNF